MFLNEVLDHATRNVRIVCGSVVRGKDKAVVNALVTSSVLFVMVQVLDRIGDQIVELAFGK